jgi:hypothetical protein
VFRYERTGNTADLDQAVSAATQAVRATLDGHFNQERHLCTLAVTLLVRAERTGAESDLDTAIALFERGIEMSARENLLRVQALGGLSRALQMRFSRTGSNADLDAAIDAGQRAVAAPIGSSPFRAAPAGCLSTALLVRYMRTSSQADLDAAVAAGHTAVRLLQPGHPDTAMHLVNLSLVMRQQYERTRESRYLDEAVAITRQALAATPADHIYRPVNQVNLAVGLVSRYLAANDARDLDEAISLARQAAEKMPDGHGYQGYCLGQLGVALHLRFAESADIADLAEAVTVVQRAVAATKGGPDAANYLLLLGGICESRFGLTGTDEDAAEALARYTEAAHTESSVPGFRIWAAQAGAELAGRAQPQRAADLLADAVLLLPLTAPRQVARADQQYSLSQFASLASDAAALALQAGGPDAAARALGLLELGRAVLQGQALDLRSDLTELHVAQPALAGKFLKLRDQLDQPEALSPEAPLSLAATVPTSIAAGPDRHSAAAEFAALVHQIRGLPGFESFLLPPEASALTRQARTGPIAVFNISRYRSDAMVVTADAITQIPLSDLDLDTLTNKIDAFNDALAATLHTVGARRVAAENILSQTLEWLWDSAAEPVLRHLGHVAAHASASQWPRVWWIPGGLLGQLPLHAAGYHRQASIGKNVLDRVISSYTPTIRALSYARDRAPTYPPRSSLIVAMPTTPGQNALPYVETEAATLRDTLPSPVLLIDQPGPVTERTPTKQAVLERLPRASIAHFSCHAASDPRDPSQSMIVLHDYQESPFTVASLVPIRLDQVQLAFLSACQTARTTVTDLLDEGIHLTSAFQIAGYPHVIGTLWPIYDSIGANVASAFYARLRKDPQTFDTSAAAQALNDVIRELRNEPGLASMPSLWAAYMHAGA